MTNENTTTNENEIVKTCLNCKHISINNITGSTLCWKQGKTPKKVCKKWKAKKTAAEKSAR